MAKTRVSKEQAGFIENLGLWFEHMGLPRIAGKVYAWLLVCNPAEQTAAQIAEATGGSKGSISTNTRLLEHHGLIERVGVPGVRSVHYRHKPSGWIEWLRLEQMATGALLQLLRQAKEFSAKSPPQTLRRLELVERLMEKTLEMMPSFMEELETFYQRELEKD